MLFSQHIVEINGTNNALVRSYAWGLDLSGTMDGAGGVGSLLWVTLHAASGSASGTQFVCYDGNGNIVALVNAATGDVIARYEYGPFGEPIRITGPASSRNPFRFSTKRTENNTDLVLYENTAYSPSLGLFSNSDPIGELGGLNLYGFVGNNPIGRVDTDGRAWWPPSEWPIWPKPKPKPPVQPPKKPKEKCRDCDKQDNPAKELFKMAADTLAGEVGGKAGGIVRLLLLASDAKKGCGDMMAAGDTCADFARKEVADPGYAFGAIDCQFCCQAIMGSFPGLGGFDYYSCLNICRRF
jgi:RHS repeat-associated protein